MPVSLSVIIVSYNVKYFLEQCLHTVRRASGGLRVEVIVVDNASADGSVAYLEPLFPEVQFLGSATNMGFAKACNLGYRHSSGSHVLFLNPDVLLGEDTLHTCLRFFATNPDAGGVGVRMIDGSGRFLPESKRGFPTPLTALFKLTGLSALAPRSRVFSRYYLGHLSEEQNQQVDVLAGAFMMMPRTVLEQTGAFDEAFFMYGEDIDLSYRIKQAGFANYYLADTTIIHFKGESTRRASIRYVRMFYNAMSIFVRKHYRGSLATLLYLLLQMAIWLRAGVALAGKLFSFFGISRSQKDTAGHLPVAIYATPAAYEQLSSEYRNRNHDTVLLRQLAETGTLRQGQQLVIAPGEGSMQACMQQMRRTNGSLQYRFFMPGCGSIIGSNAGHRSGTVLVLRGSRVATARLHFVN